MSMSPETVPDIPEQIREMMRDEEIENMQSLDGWAVGTVAPIEEDEVRTVTERIENAWIELFNGAGRAGEFGGVRFMAIDSDGEYREAYAYPDRDSLDGNEPGWYVAEYDAPENPDVGIKYPDGPGVTR